MKRSPLPKRKAPIPRSGKPKARNQKRKNREWARAFGSAERVEFIKSLSCIAAHARDCDGPIENTHIIGGGMGRRSDAEHIVPCCRRHHHELHTVGARFFEMHRCVNLRACAAETERAWLDHLSRAA